MKNKERIAFVYSWNSARKARNKVLNNDRLINNNELKLFGHENVFKQVL